MASSTVRHRWIELQDIPCVTCGTIFSPKTSASKACSKKCLDTHWLNKRKLLWATDPQYRETRRLRHLSWKRNNRDSQNEKERERYAALKAEEKARLKELAANRYRKNKQHIKEINSAYRIRMRIEQPWKVHIATTRHRSKKEHIPFDLTDAWAKARWTGRCEITDIPFTIGVGNGPATPLSPSIDKIDPTKGYLQSNCRFVLHGVNCLKGTGDDALMFRIAQAIANSTYPRPEQS